MFRNLTALLPALFLTLLLSCESAPASAPENEAMEPTELGPNAALIRNPVDGGGDAIDTVNVAKLAFDESTEFKFGSIKEGEVVNHDFSFTNTGNVPLLITKAKSTCGCTVPSYPEQPIAPGERGVISVRFDSQNKYGRQRKAVSITANTYPATSVVYVDGEVINEK